MQPVDFGAYGPRIEGLLMLAEGARAPDFILPDQEERPTSLSDYRGRWLVLWWFPAAFTSG